MSRPTTHPVSHPSSARCLLCAALLAAGLPAAAAEPTLPALAERAEKGDAEAQYQLALRYLDGRGVTVDEAWGITWLRQAAAAGHLGARDRLRLLYRQAGLADPFAPAAPPTAPEAAPAVPAPSVPTASPELALPEDEQRAIALARKLGLTVYFGSPVEVESEQASLEATAPPQTLQPEAAPATAAGPGSPGSGAEPAAPEAGSTSEPPSTTELVAGPGPELDREPALETLPGLEALPAAPVGEQAPPDAAPAGDPTLLTPAVVTPDNRPVRLAPVHGAEPPVSAPRPAGASPEAPSPERSLPPVVDGGA